LDPDGERLWHTAGPLVPHDWLPVISPLHVSPRAGCCGAATLLKERVIVADVATDINWLDEYRGLAIGNGIRAAWSEPILTKDGEVLGTFALYSSEPRTPTDAETELIEGARHVALIAIERQRSRDALTTALNKIAKSEVRLRRIIDTIPILAWCSSPDGSGEFWNQRWHDYTGLSLETIRGWGWQAAIHPDDLREITDKWLGFLASGQPGEVEGRLRRFDGEYRWFLFRAHPLRDELGNIVNWYGANIDIDDRKRTEDQILRDQSELRRITDAIPNAIIVLDPDGKAIYANRVALDYLVSPELPHEASHFTTRSWLTSRRSSRPAIPA
jgi:PAS domain S-box-containing protein